MLEITFGFLVELKTVVIVHQLHSEFVFSVKTLIISDYAPEQLRTYKASDHTQIWSFPKRSWLTGNGPTYPKGYFAYNACAVALNRSAVLVAGLIETDDFSALQDEYEHLGTYPNNEVLIYSFDSNSWSRQEPCPFPPEIDMLDYMIDFACTLIQDKNQSRFKDRNQF